MAAMLEKNGPDGKSAVLPDSLRFSEVIRCGERFCEFSYTLAYGATENRMESGQNVLDVLRRRAEELITDNHPAHMVTTYVWGGIAAGWLDREAARAAGL